MFKLVFFGELFQIPTSKNLTSVSDNSNRIAKLYDNLRRSLIVSTELQFLAGQATTNLLKASAFNERTHVVGMDRVHRYCRFLK